MARTQTTPPQPQIAPPTPPNSQEQPSPLPGRDWRRAMAISGWTLLALVAIDITVNRLFPYPASPSNRVPSSVETHFNYGRSAQGKLAQLVGPTDATSHPLAKVGWLNPEDLAQLPNQPAQPANPNAPLMAFYGMSFTVQIGEAIAAIAPELAQRHIAAPSAGPSYALAAYKADRPNNSAAQVVVMGIMADSIKSIRTMTGASWQFISPAAYSYPRYHLVNGELMATQPKVDSLGKLREAMANPQLWQDYQQQLAQEDVFYHPAIFGAAWLDHSTIARIIRRNLAQQFIKQREAQVHNGQGFIDPETNELLLAMVQRFATEARNRNQLPIVLLIDSRGYNDHLMQLLEPVLSQGQIPYLSTNQIAPANDPQTYLPDGHFSPDVNRQLAQALLAKIEAEQPGFIPNSHAPNGASSPNPKPD